MNSIPFSPFTEVAKQLDQWGEKGIPFVFLVDYSLENAWAGSEEEAKDLGILFEFDGSGILSEQVSFQKTPLSFESYAEKFKQVQAGLKRGDSFLLNLTAETPIETSLHLSEIFQRADAPYKIRCRDQFTSFSPETFVRVQGNKISSFPMKGTLEVTANSDARQLQNDPKEKAEHATIVDLIRNDLSKVAFPIRVEKYQYIERVKTNSGELWQMSSKISGELIPELRNKYGSILLELLPAGSITGAPKKATMQLIKEAEQYDRGFYTGIMGKFDGKSFNSGVMIRFIEKQNEGLVFKSGGGITVFSDVKKEYDELIQKVYLPF
ncbi:aminodeoxychorismate synthase component I [Aquirufa lenticrescens]|uniref:aminodeoxychorismate synthase component I n=1 Tax=Aquirufa lenticrescens TaxID=2696560 RepID=UPI001CAA4458|nr:aminodeoxychorismate synthase component I [Aquirufa lenticrescens]UAJ13023.1 aminodeoxychorismate synthase component I [Aquirufa lenticrescens]